MFPCIVKYENDQQDATGWDNLLFLGCSTRFEQYFRSSSGASKLYYSFWYYTRMSLPAGIMGELELWLLAIKQPQNLYGMLLYVQSSTPDDGRKARPKHVECCSKIK